MDTINVTMTPSKVIEYVAQRIEKVIEPPFGDVAGPPPSSEHLAAIAIDALSDFGLLDGSYFAVVQEARGILPSYES